MSKGGKSARAASKVSLAILISRVLGLVREQFFASLFGASLYNDAWLVALRLPNLMRDLFAEGALSSAFVPTFTKYLKSNGRSDAWHLANLVLSSLLVILGLVTVVLFLFSEVFVHGLAAGYSEVPGKVEVTSTLIKILSPFLIFVALASVAMGVLNTLNHYFIPALAPALFNITIILFALFAVPEFDQRGILPIYAMGFGALAGGLLQYAIQIPLLRKEGFRFRFRIDLKHPGIRRIGKLLGPAIVGVSAVQINVLINTQLASFLQDNGPVSWLSYAFRIIYLPIGLFGVAVGVVNLKEVSAHAARKEFYELRETVANSLKLVAFLAIPSTVGLVVLGYPIVDLLFERGDFLPRDTEFTTYALMAYSLGLFAYSCVKVYVPTFYALNDTRTPVRISVTAVAVNLATNLLLIWVLPAGYRYIGLAFGTAVSVSFNSLLLATSFRKRLGSMKEFHVLPTLSKVLVSALIMGVGVFWLNRYLQQTWGALGLLEEILALIVTVAIGAVLYFGGSWILKVEEVKFLIPQVRR